MLRLYFLRISLYTAASLEAIYNHYEEINIRLNVGESEVTK